MIMLIGVVSSFITVSNFQTSKTVNSEASLSMLLISMVNKAQIEQKWYGLQIETSRYRMMEYSDHGWVTSGTRGWVVLPDHFELELSPVPRSDMKSKVHLYVNPKGLLSPYSLYLVTPDLRSKIKSPYDTPIY